MVHTASSVHYINLETLFIQVMERLSTGKRLSEMTGIMDEIKTYTVKVTDLDQNLDILRKWADETKDRNIDKIGIVNEV